MNKYTIFLDTENVEKLHNLVDETKDETFSDVINRLIKKTRK